MTLLASINFIILISSIFFNRVESWCAIFFSNLDVGGCIFCENVPKVAFYISLTSIQY